MGCMACHATDDGRAAQDRPGLERALRQEARHLQRPKRRGADDYLRESILTPAAKIVKGYEKIEAGMPVYSGVLNDAQIDSLILFIKTLQ